MGKFRLFRNHAALSAKILRFAKTVCGQVFGLSCVAELSLAFVFASQFALLRGCSGSIYILLPLVESVKLKIQFHTLTRKTPLECTSAFSRSLSIAFPHCDRLLPYSIVTRAERKARDPTTRSSRGSLSD